MRKRKTNFKKQSNSKNEGNPQLDYFKSPAKKLKRGKFLGHKSRR